MDKSTGIEIENIPIWITREELIKLFEKELKGENEINYILFPLPENKNKAFVCLKHSPDEEFIKRLMANNPAWSVKVDSRMQTYRCCTAEVDALIVASIPHIPSCIAMLQKDYGIEGSYDEDSGKFVLKGMLHQLQCAQNRLDKIFEEQKTLQSIQLLQIGTSDDTSMKKPWLDYSGRQDTGFSMTARQECVKESEKDVPSGKRSFLVDDEFESERGRRSEEWNRFYKESEYRSLPSTSSVLQDDQPLVQRTRNYEEDSKLPTSSDRTLISPSFYLDRRNRGDEPTSLPHFSAATTRYEEDLPLTGDHRLRAASDRYDTREHPSLPEYNDELFSDRYANRPTYASVAREKVDPFTYSRSSNDDWGKDYTPGQSGIRREYHASKTRMSPISDLLPSRESASRDDSTLAERTRSLASDHRDGREGVDVDAESSGLPAFWKERLDVGSERLQSLPSYSSEVTPSRLDRPQFKAQGHISHSGMSFTTSRPRPRYLTEERSEDRLRDFHEQQDEPVVTTSENDTMLFLETHVVKYIMAVEKWLVHDIKQQYEVEIKVSTEPGAEISTVNFYGKRTDEVEKASKKFAKLYEKTSNGIIQREVGVNAEGSRVADVVERVRAMYRVILITDNPGTATIVGEFRDVMKAVDMLNDVQSEIEVGVPQHGSGRFDMRSGISWSGVDRDLDLEETLLRRKDSEKTSLSGATEVSRLAKQSSKSPDLSEGLKSSSIERDLWNKKEKLDEADNVELCEKEPRSLAFGSNHDSNRYSMTFKDDVQVFIYTGDITKLRVEAIVNAANSHLKNYAGVAGAIEEAGGPQFREDCENLFLLHGPLKVSDVAHTVATGDLRCRNVIHTVGPMWYLDSDEDKCAALLLKTFENVLTYAEEILQTESLAVPAVGTGIFGIPIDVCARAIYGAIHQFAEHSSSSRLSLKSVHVVNKDPGTTELIQAVFEGLRQLELEEWMKTSRSRSQEGDEEVSEMSSLDVATSRQHSEKELLEHEKRGHDHTRVFREPEKNFHSDSGSDVDDSESRVVRQRITMETTGPPETVDATSRQGFHPMLDSDSDEF